jgi:hypothetical protein
MYIKLLIIRVQIICALLHAQLIFYTDVDTCELGF